MTERLNYWDKVLIWVSAVRLAALTQRPGADLMHVPWSSPHANHLATFSKHDEDFERAEI